MSRIAVLGTVVAPLIQQGSIVGPVITMGSTSHATLTTNSIYIEFDTGLVPDTDTLVAALNAALTFFQTSGSIVAD